jgi:aryl-alcohol dehydrogenase-like predicted oxidoreductase
MSLVSDAMHLDFNWRTLPRNLEFVEKLEEIASRKTVTSSELTLAWVIAQVFIATPGSRKIKYLDSDFSVEKIKLTSEEIREIRAVSEVVDVAGERYWLP